MREVDGVHIYTAPGRSGYHTATCRSLEMLASKAIGGPVEVADVTLAVGAQRYTTVAAGCTQVILPLAGELLLAGDDDARSVSPGQLVVLGGEYVTPWAVRNVGSDLANYLLINVDRPGDEQDGANLCDFTRLLDRGGLQTVYRGGHTHLLVGLLGGRQEGRHERGFPDGHLVAMSLAGAVEVADRLLRERDALTIAGGHTLEFECLTRGATLVVLEISAH